jgi:hypothetical protein
VLQPTTLAVVPEQSRANITFNANTITLTHANGAGSRAQGFFNKMTHKTQHRKQTNQVGFNTKLYTSM